MNRITPQPLTAEVCPVETDPANLAERYAEYLSDESRLAAAAVSAVYRPETPAQVAGALQALGAAGQTAVFSAARTGIAGAAVPVETDAVVTLEAMDRLLAFGQDGETRYVRCEAGLSLQALNRILRKKDVADLPGATEAEQQAAQAYAGGADELWFPVDPTEMTAHVGGIVATNASGARSYRYGATRAWVRALTVILADGRLLTVRRGEVTAQGRTFLFEQADGSETEIVLPAGEMPQTKCTLGYVLQDGADLIDLFCGSEGTLGAIVEIELALAPRPESVLGVLAVVEDEEKALTLVEGARASSMPLGAIEYFDHDALLLLREKKEADGASSEIPEIPSWDGAAVYLELEGTEDETEEACMELEELLAGVGSSIDETWAAMEPAELDEQKTFRHMVPETVNLRIGQRAAQVPGLHKVGTDMAVPDAALREVFRLYREGLADAGLESVVFGHIGNNHVHVNILPKTLDELKQAKDLYLAWAEAVVQLGGAVSAEHGIGRIKRPMLEVQYPPAVLEGMRAIRQAFDPRATLAPGVLV